MIQSVSDVTASNNLVTSNVKPKKTTITPFIKVLEESVSRVPEKTDAENNTSAAASGESTLKSIFREAAEKYNISYDLLAAVAKAESNFNPGSTSGKGAQGIMQLMPATAKELGVTDAYDVRQNIMAGAKYLAGHLKAFNGNVDYAVAAYNAGGGAVRKYNGIPPYSETQNYVKIVNRYLKEGVEVPDRIVKDSGEKEDTAPKAQDATEKDMLNSTVVIGSGDSAVTMTYGAYLRYLELGEIGVG